MSKRFSLILTVLLLCLASAAPAANIIVVAENVDRGLDRVADDQGLIDWLVAEGHSVDIRRNTWEHLSSERMAQLNAADLIIVRTPPT